MASALPIPVTWTVAFHLDGPPKPEAAEAHWLYCVSQDGSRGDCLHTQAKLVGETVPTLQQRYC
jgi:hypothetical protein